MIETHGLSKLYGDRVAVDDLSFTVRPGRVTGFLGPNGAGKTTTMRLILGLDSPSGGSATINGKPFAQVYSPMREVVRGLGPERAGEPALANGIAPHYLAPARVSLEEAFMELTADSVGYHAKDDPLGAHQDRVGTVPYWTLLTQAVAAVAFAGINCAGIVAHGEAGPGFNAAQASLLGQVALGALLLAAGGWLFRRRDA